MTRTFTLEGNDFWLPGLPISVTRERERFTLPLHIHDFVEIQYVAEGKGFHYIGDERLSVEKGDLFIIPIGTRHVYRPASEASKDELIVYNCLFAKEVPDMLTPLFPLGAKMERLLGGDAQPYRRYKDRHNEARKCMESLYAEYRTRAPGFEAVLSGLLIQLLISLYRAELNLKENPPQLAALGPVLQYLEEHYNEPVRLAELAGMLHVSGSHLQRLLKQATGQSLTEYLQNLRIDKSLEMLTRTRLTVKEIAHRAGYHDLKFFHRLFLKKTGKTPSEYRRLTSAAARQSASGNGNSPSNVISKGKEV